MNKEKALMGFGVNSVCREDLKDYLTDEQISNLTDEDMKYIASKMGDIMQEDYWNALEVAVEPFTEKENFCPKCGKCIPYNNYLCQSCADGRS